ncbi:GAF domain-containing sensor histidine kinase [Halobaculum sp. CBA1158]|uniref:sensor histidine kinase n=1 Tax=Halobaculum sp. CBA1158 TaxID=2904243 RepID=UPI001F26ECD8|nr:GAF domain-containing sensor histidine kinase [Halobaculum sp. CBA1158]UIO99634.1 GAF domain-containing sensor histidine kinase [Halobaculum sp. CBA1158]
MTADGAGNAATGSVERLRAVSAATRDLMTATTREALCSVVVEVSVGVLGYDLTGVHLRGDDGVGLEPAAYPDAVRREFDDEPPTYTPGDRVYGVFDRGEPLRLGDAGDDPGGVVVPIPDHGVLIAGTDAAVEAGTETPPASIEPVELLADNAAVALDRLKREERLNGLHGATRELMTARDTAAVAATATNTAHEVLGLRTNAVCLRSTDGERLVPVSVTSEARERFGDVPDLTPDSVAWEVYERGELARYDSAERAGSVADPGTAIESELVLPLGDHGVFLAGSTRPDEFGDRDVTLARVFADNVEAALGRADREAVSRQRERELARQNERLDEFASVVSHDLRNPLNVAQGRLELLGDDCDSPHISHIAEAHDRMETLIDDLLALARTGQSMGDTEAVALASTVETVWETVDGGEDLTVADDVGHVEADPSRLRELFENLLRNAVEHGGDDVRVRVGRFEDPDGDAGVYVADDGPGIAPERRDRVFERGHTSTDDGTGFGLAIVAEVVRAHGWDVRATDAETGGARFEIVLDSDGERDDSAGD